VNMPDRERAAMGALKRVEIALAFSGVEFVEPHLAQAFRTGQRQFCRRAGFKRDGFWFSA